MESLEDIRQRLELALNTCNYDEIMHCLRVVNEQGWNLGLDYFLPSNRSAIFSPISQSIRTEEEDRVLASEQTLVATSFRSGEIGRDEPYFPTESSRSIQPSINLSLGGENPAAFDSSSSSGKT